MFHIVFREQFVFLTISQNYLNYIYRIVEHTFPLFEIHFHMTHSIFKDICMSHDVLDN